MRRIIYKTLFGCFLLPPTFCMGQTYTKLDSLTVRIESYKCPSLESDNGSRILTGVKINDGSYSGIITALHGVCGCDEIVVFDVFGNSAPVYLEFANIEKDIAVLNLKEVNQIFNGGYRIPDSLDIKKLDNTTVFINGHPLGSDITTLRGVETFAPALVPLSKMIGPKLINELKKRNSPQIDVLVLRYGGGSGPGTSGAPVIYNDQLVAIQNGGLIEYGELTCWGVPLIDFEKWEFIRGNDLKKDLRYKKISMPPSGDLYSVRPEYPKRPSVVFPDTSALKLYILPFTNRQGEKLVGLE